MSVRTWCAKIQYPGLEPIMFGSVAISIDAKHHEIIQEVTTEAVKHIPGGFVIMDLLPGSIFFQPEGEME